MAKRFTDTDIWKKQRWFKKMPALYKLAWGYIKDMCDHAGIWRIDCSDLVEDLGLEGFDIHEFIRFCNTEYDNISGNRFTKERVKVVQKKYLWITGLIQFQYENKEGLVSTNAGPVRTALQILNGLYILDEAINEGYVTLTEPLPKGYVTLTEPSNKGVRRAKDKDKDIDKDISTTGMIDIKDRIQEDSTGEKKIKEIQQQPPKSNVIHVERHVGLTHDMVQVFKSAYPVYPVDTDKDLSSCLEIAYKIGDQKKITKEQVNNGKQSEILTEWRDIVSFSKTDKWFSGRSITDFNKEYQRLIQTMVKEKTKQQAPLAKKMVY